MSISFPRLRKGLAIIYSNKISAPFSLSSPLGLLVKLLSTVRLFVIPWTVAYRLLCSWNFPGKSTGVGCHSLLQGIFPTLGIEPRSPALQADTLPSESSGKSSKLVWQPQVAWGCPVSSLSFTFIPIPHFPTVFAFFFFSALIKHVICSGLSPSSLILLLPHLFMCLNLTHVFFSLVIVFQLCVFCFNFLIFSLSVEVLTVFI